jgi:ATPase subunit of ABC transporter with duplicated ATPase domains
MSAASIVLSDLTLSASDGRPLLSNINLRFASERTGLVGRNGVGKSTLLELIASGGPPRSGSMAVSGTLGVFRQSVQIHADETIADLFGVRQALKVLRRAEKGQATTEELAHADWTLDVRLASALARVGLDAPPDTRLIALSGGQRTRAGLAALVFAEPDFLLLDEPTNNLDRNGRRAVHDLLTNWRAGAIVVSHDRELLDIMDSIVELTSLGADRYGGNGSAYRERKAEQLAAARHDLAEAERHASNLARKAQIAVERKARRDSVGQRKNAKGGAPRIALGGMKAKSENAGGANKRLAESRQSQAVEAVATARRRIEVVQPLSVVVPSTRLPLNRTVLRVKNVAFGYEPGRPIIQNLSFDIVGPERIAVTGPNASGKTTLMELLAGDLRPWHGTIDMMGEFAMLDQKVSLLDPSASIRDNFRRVNPGADENSCRAALARFMFRADSALQLVSSLSGGETLRAGLACVLGENPPPLLMLDEPTNHLDLDSIEAVEAGLRAYDGALLVVSHDGAFFAALGMSRTLELSPDIPADRD